MTNPLIEKNINTPRYPTGRARRITLWASLQCDI